MAINGRHDNGSGGAPGRRRLRLVTGGGVATRSPADDDGEVVDRFLASDFAIDMTVPPDQAAP
jgi:hypothetical protein